MTVSIMPCSEVVACSSFSAIFAAISTGDFSGLAGVTTGSVTSIFAGSSTGAAVGSGSAATGSSTTGIA